MAPDEKTAVLGTPGVGLAGEGLREQLTRRWRAIDRGGKAAVIGMSVLVAGALAVRLWLILSYGPGFLGFPDSQQYVNASAGIHTLFETAQKPAGYPIFLEVARLLSNEVSFAIQVQHFLGIATGVLLYKAVRRAGAPPYLGLLPAAIVFFGGTGLLLEHSLLSDSLFAFAQAVGVYAVVRALRDPAPRWPVLAGVAIGASFWIKTVGLSSAVLVPLLLLLAAPGDARRRLASAAAAGGAALVVILGYLAGNAALTGRIGYERQDGWNLYGRVATFVDCSRFTPPAGTAFLCPAEAPGHRAGQAFFQYDRRSPAVRRLGEPFEASRSANALLKKFSIAAIEHELGAYVAAVLRGLTYYISPRVGEIYTPQGLREELLNEEGTESIQPALSRLYPQDRGYSGRPASIRALSDYESDTRIQGAFLVVLLAAGIIGAPLLQGPARWAMILFTLTAICSATFAVAGNGYDARYAYPAFGPLAAGAALGAWGVGKRLRRAWQRRRA